MARVSSHARRVPREPWLRRPRQALYDTAALVFFGLYIFPIAALIGAVDRIASHEAHPDDVAWLIGSLLVLALGIAHLQRPVVAGRRPWWLGGGDRPVMRWFDEVRQGPSVQPVPTGGEDVSLMPEEVEQMRFTTVRFKEGYDELEVDAFLDRVAKEMRRLNDRIAELERQAGS